MSYHYAETTARSLLLVTTIGLLSTGAAAAQDAPELLRAYGDVNEVVLVDVRAAAVSAQDLTVMTRPEPAVHRFLADTYLTWGREGSGPGELRDPVDLARTADGIVVLDQRLHKLVVYDLEGRLRMTRSLSGEWAHRLTIVDGDTLIGSFVPMAGERAVVRLRGKRRDTVLAYTRSAARLRLEAPGAPSYTVAPPFTAQPRWTVLPAGRVAVWYPESTAIALVAVDGRPAGRLPVPPARYPVSDADREHWFQTAIPTEFLGRRVFEPIRRRAREVVEFPRRFPPVLELKSDPSGGVWVRKTTAGGGQVWAAVDARGRTGLTIRLPPGRALLTVGAQELVAGGTDELGVERVEVYRRPITGRR